MAQHPVRGVDHVFLLVDDLDDSQRTYERLGFTVSPRGFHSAHKGSANHTIMFAETYLELLGLIAETEENAPRRATLAREGEGLHAMACRIDDAEEAARALTALGIGTEGLSHFSRPVTMPDGSTAEAAFSTLQFTEEETPRGFCFMCQHRTREVVWIPELLEHANGAVDLSAIVAASETPRQTAEAFARLFATGKVEDVDGGARVATGERSPHVLVLSPEALAGRYADFDMGTTPAGAFAALVVAVRDLDRTRSVLEGAGVTAVPTAAGLAVAPGAASGAALEFVAAAP